GDRLAHRLVSLGVDAAAVARDADAREADLGDPERRAVTVRVADASHAPQLEAEVARHEMDAATRVEVEADRVVEALDPVAVEATEEGGGADVAAAVGGRAARAADDHRQLRIDALDGEVAGLEDLGVARRVWVQRPVVQVRLVGDLD